MLLVVLLWPVVGFLIISLSSEIMKRSNFWGLNQSFAVYAVADNSGVCRFLPWAMKLVGVSHLYGIDLSLSLFTCFFVRLNKFLTWEEALRISLLLTSLILSLKLDSLDGTLVYEFFAPLWKFLKRIFVRALRFIISLRSCSSSSVITFFYEMSVSLFSSISKLLWLTYISIFGVMSPVTELLSAGSLGLSFFETLDLASCW